MKKLLTSLLLMLAVTLQAQTVADSATTKLDEVQLAARRQNHILEVGTTTRRSCVIQPYSSDWLMLAKLFTYKENYVNTPYLKSVTVMARNKVKGGDFRLHLYKMGADSLPAEELVPEGIIVKARRGFKRNKIDLTSYNLQMPKEGVIVAYEWLKTDNNAYPYEATGKIVDGEVTIAKKSERVLTYGPDIIRNDSQEAVSYYFNQFWHKFLMNQMARQQGYYVAPAISIELSN